MVFSFFPRLLFLHVRINVVLPTGIVIYAVLPTATIITITIGTLICITFSLL